MGITASLLLTAVGAVLTWAVTASVNGVDIQAVGIILMVVGIIGFVVSLFFWSTWGGFGGPRPVDGPGGQNTTVVRGGRDRYVERY